MLGAPPVVAPPSSRWQPLPSAAVTAAAVVAGGSPARLALVVVTGPPKRVDQRARQRVRRLPDRHQAVGDQRRRQPGARRQGDRQRARPVTPHQVGGPRRNLGTEARQHGVSVDQDRDRLLAPPFDRAQTLQRRLVEGVDAETVERLRRVGDHLAAPERSDRGLDVAVLAQAFVSR